MIKCGFIRTVGFFVVCFVLLASDAGSWRRGSFQAYAQSPGASNPVVRIESVLGNFSIELFEQTAPVTVANFLNYVRDGDYNRSLIHRVVPEFIVQGGGFRLNASDSIIAVPADPPIINEFDISNTRGTVAMAKLGGDPNSATSEWFVNLVDNSGILDNQNGGFTVFGRVIDDGMAVLDAIAALRIVNASPFSDFPTINFLGSGLIIPENMVILNQFTVVETTLSTGAVSGTSATAGEAVLFTVDVTPAENPVSTQINVRADLSSIGGSSSQAFVDDATNGDAIADDETFSFRTIVPLSTAGGDTTIPVTVTDGEARTASTTIALAITRPTGSEPFTLTDRGGTSTSSQGASESTTVGYGRIRPDSGSTTPSGLAIFGFTQDGILVAEAGVPAGVPISEGRIFAEVSGPVNTGLAIANPNESDTLINFFFTDTEGTDFGSGSLTLGANEQTARFLDQEPFNSGTSILGTFTFTSSNPISVIALRGLTNERSEFLITTLLVTSLSSSGSDTIYFPHFADGGGWTTQVVLVNPTESTITGDVGFLGQGSGTASAEPVTLSLDDGSAVRALTIRFPLAAPGGLPLRILRAR